MEVIAATNRLDERQKRQVDELFAYCRECDGLLGDSLGENALNAYPEMNCYFLLTQDGQLRAFLSLFSPDPAEAEILAYTHPAHRRRGFFSRLMAAAVKELRTFGVREALLVHEPSSQGAREVLGKIGATLSHSEYLLNHDGFDAEICAPASDLTLECASSKDSEALIALNARAFGGDKAATASIVKNSLESQEIVVYIAKREDVFLGTVSVRVEEAEAAIFGVAIDPLWQGKGYGKHMMRLLLGELHRRNVRKIAIEVGSENTRALALYRAVGFAVAAQFDYYRLEV